jgi:hypothetical protein
MGESIFAGSIVVLVAAMGRPYQQTWYGRWHR